MRRSKKVAKASDYLVFFVQCSGRYRREREAAAKKIGPEEEDSLSNLLSLWKKNDSISTACFFSLSLSTLVWKMAKGTQRGGVVRSGGHLSPLFHFREEMEERKNFFLPDTQKKRRKKVGGVAGAGLPGGLCHRHLATNGCIWGFGACKQKSIQSPLFPSLLGCLVLCLNLS